MAKIFFYFEAKKKIIPEKWWHHQKKVIALNLYIGNNVLVYDRCLVLKVWYTAGPTLLPLHRLTLLMNVSQKIIKKNEK